MIDAVLPVIQVDYFYAGADGVSQLALVAVCRSTGMTFACGCAAKGPSQAYPVQALAAFLLEIGHHRMVLQTDGEPSIVALGRAVRDQVVSQGRAEQVTLQASPVGSHQSNGAAERAISTIRGLARVYLEALSNKTGLAIGAGSEWWPWALRHAAWVYNRFHVRRDLGCTPYAKVRHKAYGQPVLGFAEQVLARRPGAHLNKAESQFVHGAWLGRDVLTDERIVRSKAGVFRARTVRKLVAERAWSREAAAEMVWLPWYTADVTRGRPPRAVEGEPIVNAPLPTGAGSYRLTLGGPARPAIEAGVQAGGAGSPVSGGAAAASQGPSLPIPSARVVPQAGAAASSGSGAASSGQAAGSGSPPGVPMDTDLSNREAASGQTTGSEHGSWVASGS